MSALYIIRLDDACPTMNKENWQRTEDILERYKIKPIIAIIPNNRDPEMVIDDADSYFWDKVQNWKRKGWCIGLHGYDHGYIKKNPGLIPMNKQSEFAGVDLKVQKMKIRKASEKFNSLGIEPDVFIAPSHTFDKNTLRSLREETNIRVISDGIAFYPYVEHGFLWIPQQNWRLTEKKEGVWTSCYHPNSMVERNFVELESFVKKNKNNIVSDYSLLFREYKNRKRSIKEKMFFFYFFLHRRLFKIRKFIQTFI